MLTEFMPTLEKAKSNFMRDLDYDMAEGFEFTRMCFLESLRIEPPVQATSPNMFNRDVVLSNGVTLRKNDEVYLCFKELHHDPQQWQQPEKFLPDRFDPKHPLYKKPDGGQRHAYAFSPFFGGKRICIGKTFTEILVRFTIPLLYFHFDFDFVKEEHKTAPIEYSFGGTREPDLPMTLTIKNQCQ